MLTRSKLLYTTGRNFVQKRLGHAPTPAEAKALCQKYGVTMDNVPVRAGNFKQKNKVAQAKHTRYALGSTLGMAAAIFYAWHKRVFTTHQLFRYPKAMYDK